MSQLGEVCAVRASGQLWRIWWSVFSMDIVLPVGPSVAMLFSLEQSKMPEKWDFYSDITQAISHVIKTHLETGHWVEPISSSAAGSTAHPMPQSCDSSAPEGQDPQPGFTRITLSRTALLAFPQQGFPGTLLWKMWSLTQHGMHI